MAARALRRTAVAASKLRWSNAPTAAAARTWFLVPALRIQNHFSPAVASSRAFCEMVCEDRMMANEDYLEFRSLWRLLERHESIDIIKELKRWESEGNTFTKPVMLAILLRLRTRKRYRQATRLLLFAAEERRFELVEKDFVQLVTYASRIQAFQTAKRAVYELLPPHLDKWPVISALISGYASVKMVDVAEKLINEHKPPCVGAYNTIIISYIRRGFVKRIPGFLKFMEENGVKPNVLTYTVLLKYRDRIGDLPGLEQDALKTLNDVDLDALDFKYIVAGNMIEAYSYLGKADYVEKMWIVLDQERWIPPGLYVKAVEAFARVGEFRKAEMVAKIKEGNWKIEGRLCQAAAMHFSKIGRMDKAEMALVRAAERRLEPSFSIYNHVILGFLANNEPEKALEKLKQALAEVTVERAVPGYKMVMGMLPVLAKHKDVRLAEELAGRYRGWRGLEFYHELLKVYIEAKEPLGHLSTFLIRMQRQRCLPNDTTKRLIKRLRIVTRKRPSKPNPSEVREDCTLEEPLSPV